MITAERLRALLHYDPETGVFTWKISTSNRVQVGDQAGCVRAGEYTRLRLDGRLYQGHQLAWLYMTGEPARGIVDHENNKPGDDRWINLRKATGSENSQNSKRKRNNNWPKGVYQHIRTGKFKSQIRARGVHYYLGTFDTPEEAHEAYVLASKKHHGEFARAA